MKDNFDACLAFTLLQEGGWANNPLDPGGATMKGITLRTFRNFNPNATKDDLKNISDDDLHTIYKTMYWDKIGGDGLPVGMDLACFDYAVNSGTGVIPRALADAAAVSSITAKIIAVCNRRLSLVEGLRTFAIFGKTCSRRIADCRVAALKMAQG